MDPYSMAMLGSQGLSGLLGGLTENPQEKLMKQQAYASKQLLPSQMEAAKLGNQMTQAQLDAFQQMFPEQFRAQQLQNYGAEYEIGRRRSLNPLAQQGMNNIMGVLTRTQGPGAVMDRAAMDKRDTLPPVAANSAYNVLGF